MKSRKLIKLAEKYKRELEEANLEIRDLKAKLLESTEFKVSEAVKHKCVCCKKLVICQLHSCILSNIKSNMI